MKKVLLSVWIAVGVVLIGAIVSTTIHVNEVVGDIHAVSDSVTMEDVRMGMQVLEKAIDLEILLHDK